MERLLQTEDQRPQQLHFVGIGGSGMGSLAELAVGKGHSVQGSDTGSSSRVEGLRKLGITIFSKHAPENLRDCNRVIWSSAVAPDNIELVAASDLKIPLWHRSQLLAELMQDKIVITVSGSHGKTTVTAMLAVMFTELGLDPDVVIGGQLADLGVGGWSGNGRYFIAEADESDGSLLNYHPHINVLTSADADHLDFYKSKGALHATYLKYLDQTEEGGCAVIGWDNSASRDIGMQFRGRRLTYGKASECNVRGNTYGRIDGGASRFEASVDDQLVVGNIEAIGEHNLQNVLACLGVAQALELPIAKAARALGAFHGVKRRLEQLLADQKLVLIDDYAHNPGKVAAALRATKEAWPTRRAVAIFQPHRYTRVASLFEEFATAFKDAGELWLLPVYSAGESRQNDSIVLRLAEAIETGSSVTVIHVKSFADAKSRFARLARLAGSEPCLVVTLGAGDVTVLAHQLREIYLEEKQAPTVDSRSTETEEKKK